MPSLRSESFMLTSLRSESFMLTSLRSESFMLTSLVHNLNEVQSLCSVKSFMMQQGAIVIREKNT